MIRLEQISRNSLIKGVVADEAVLVIDVKWHGSDVIELVYKTSNGSLGSELLFRDKEPTLEIEKNGLPWSFEGDGALLRLALEAYRIRMAYLFDPVLAVHTSLVDALPHQITAVYGEMLNRQPLRYLLADDPGAGKTIMTGLFIKELLIRGDVKRCLIVCPGMLAEQWQDELYSRFHLPFEILTNDKVEAARGNWFEENDLVICRLDKLSRDHDLQEKLQRTDWDLVVCDEAHKMSATFSGGEIQFTKRYRLGQLLSELCRHFLLLSATPHNGKEEDFQLFMALLDGDRFEGRFRDGVHVADTSDMMRRLVKEQLLKFDGTPLFPERLAYTVNYKLSDNEAALYRTVTDYVQQEFNRADALENEGRKGTVGFALTVLQRRLASSPEAIYQSLKRRKERLEKRLREEQIAKRGADAQIAFPDFKVLSKDDIEDLEDAPESEIEEVEEEIVDRATAAQTIAELQVELAVLRRLEELALKVRRSGTDKKWDELSKLLQNNSEMFDAAGRRRKLVIFTEHRDTLNYLVEQIQGLIGRNEAVVTIHGGMGREERKKSQELFTQDKEVQILIATDAAGEGINLQRAHLMVNYDLPWNPNRLEQRFGRIHRIGQREVCHLWNLVAEETREGDVFNRLLKKLEIESKALGGGVFDILGKVFQGVELRQLLIQAIRYGERIDVKERLSKQVDHALDHNRLEALLEERALSKETMDQAKVRAIREDMERAEARRLQPHFVSAFFQEAFRLLGGSLRERESKRFEITHVPSSIRNRDRLIGTREPVLARYERVTFEKSLISFDGKPPAAFVCPGHPLLDATMDLILERHRNLLKQGAILVDETDFSDQPRVLFFLEHSIQDGRRDKLGSKRVVSKRLQFIEVGSDTVSKSAGYAPYLDYRASSVEERALVLPLLKQEFLNEKLEDKVISFAASNLIPEHLTEVRTRRELIVQKTLSAVKDRLTKEIIHWDHRALELEAQEQAGKIQKLNSSKARQRADELQGRLQRRLEELEQERQLSALPPHIIGGALVVPIGLLARLSPPKNDVDNATSEARMVIEKLAMEAVMQYERELGFEPKDVSLARCGYDIESHHVAGQPLRFIEVKGRYFGAKTVTVTKNEILTALNKPEQFILALVEVNQTECKVRYLRRPFIKDLDFAVTSITYDIDSLVRQSDEDMLVASKGGSA